MGTNPAIEVELDINSGTPNPKWIVTGEIFLLETSGDNLGSGMKEYVKDQIRSIGSTLGKNDSTMDNTLEMQQGLLRPTEATKDNPYMNQIIGTIPLSTSIETIVITILRMIALIRLLSLEEFLAG